MEKQETIDLSKLILDLAVRRLVYYFGPNQRRVLKTTGGAILIAKITCEKGFKWINLEPKIGKKTWKPNSEKRNLIDYS